MRRNPLGPSVLTRKSSVARFGAFVSTSQVKEAGIIISESHRTVNGVVRCFSYA